MAIDEICSALTLSNAEFSRVDHAHGGSLKVAARRSATLARIRYRHQRGENATASI